MRKKLFFLISFAFLLILNHCKPPECRNGSRNGKRTDAGAFDFRLLSKQTNDALVGDAGSPYLKDTVRVYLISGNILVGGAGHTDPTGRGYFFRNIPINGYSPPDFTEHYVLYLNQFDSDTISLKAINVGDCPTIAEFYYNGVSYGQHEIKNNTPPLLVFKK
jgi:hypothetical protein